MKKNLIIILSALFLLPLSLQAKPNKTLRIQALDNEQVKVWQTIIYPAKHETLPMHRHEVDRVVIALDEGTLKITNDKGKVSYFKLEKNKAYFLKKDKGQTLHQDENISGHPIRVFVVELKP